MTDLLYLLGLAKSAGSVNNQQLSFEQLDISEKLQLLHVIPSPTVAAAAISHKHHQAVRHKRAKLMLFVQALIKYLENSGSPELVRQIRLNILDCTRRNRSGDPACTPLSRSVLVRARQTLGNWHWEQFQGFFRSSMEEQRTMHFARSIARRSLTTNQLKRLQRQKQFVRCSGHDGAPAFTGLLNPSVQDLSSPRRIQPIVFMEGLLQEGADT